MSALPESLERWCCRGKSCGNTQLYITSEQPTVGPGEAPLPTLYTVRRRSNDDVYGIAGATEAAVLAWIEETRDEVNP